MSRGRARAPQLLPSGEYVELSRVADRGRFRWSSEEIADSARKGLFGDGWFLRSVARGEVALLFLPERHGNPSFGDYRRHPSYGNYPERTSYVGALALFALLSGLVWLPPRGHRRFFLIAGWLTFGALLHLPILNLVTCVPILKLAAAHRLRFVFALCAAVTLGLAVSEWLPLRERGNRQPRRRVWVVALALALLCAVLGAATLPLLSQARGEAFAPADRVLRIAKLFAPAAAAAVLTFLLLPSVQTRLGRGVVMVALVCVATSDLLLFAARWHPMARPGNVLPQLPPIQAIRQLAESSRITAPPNVFRPNLSVGYEIYDARSYDPIAVDRFVRLVEAFHGELDTSPWLQQGSDTPVPALHRLTSVKYVWHNDPSSGLTICQCSDTLPRAYVTDRVRACTADGALDAVTSGLDPRQETLVEEISVGLPPTNGFLHPASLVSYTPHRIVLRARAERPCWLVLTDTYYPGWTATVNGRPTRIMIANYAFRAVPIPPGDSPVTFTYEPASYRVGLFIGLLAAMAALALFTAEALAALQSLHR